jgi:glycosyltransferase involved in cell wall biosynthesis
MKISVVIPTYRRPELLLKCLRALITQKFERDNYEIIVVSDGPDELTTQLYKKWIRRKIQLIHFYSLPEKKGPAAARNYGWLQAKGELIAFTDDDCIPDRYWLQRFWEAYTTQGQRNAIAFTGKTIVPLPKNPTDYERNVGNLQTADFITANCCCSKKALELTGGFDEKFSMAWREDSDLEFKLIQENIPVIKIERAVVVHPVRKASWGISIKEQRKTMFNALLYKKFPDLYRQKVQPTPPWSYYATIGSFLIFLSGVITHNTALAAAGVTGWSALTIIFICRRLRNTTLRLSHVAEMVITSFVIPFLSIYWQFYGDFKFKVVLI